MYRACSYKETNKSFIGYQWNPVTSTSNECVQIASGIISRRCYAVVTSVSLEQASNTTDNFTSQLANVDSQELEVGKAAEFRNYRADGTANQWKNGGRKLSSNEVSDRVNEVTKGGTTLL